MHDSHAYHYTVSAVQEAEHPHAPDLEEEAARQAVQAAKEGQQRVAKQMALQSARLDEATAKLALVHAKRQAEAAWAALELAESAVNAAEVKLQASVKATQQASAAVTRKKRPRPGVAKSGKQHDSLQV